MVEASEMRKGGGHILFLSGSRVSVTLISSLSFALQYSIFLKHRRSKSQKTQRLMIDFA